MRVQVRKLRDVMGLLQPVIPKKPTIKVIGNILLKDGKAVAMNLETTVIADFPEADGQALLPLSLLDFLRYVPGDTVARIDPEGERTMSISCNGSKRTFPYTDPDEYPPAPELPPLDLHVDGDRLLEAMEMAAPYAARKDDRPVLKGVTLVIGKEGSHVAAGDGFRMFYKGIPCKAEPTVRVIPEEAVSLMKDLWKKTARPESPAMDALLAQIAIARRIIRLGFNDSVEPGVMAARFGEVTVLVKLIGGTPPDFAAVIPTVHEHSLKLFAQDLYRAVLQVANVAAEGAGIVRLQWSGNELKVSAVADDQTVEAQTFVTSEGGDGCIAFHVAYLLKYLKERQGMVDLKCNRPDGPGLFLDGKSTVVIMPMFVQWGDTPSDEESEAFQTQEEGEVPADRDTGREGGHDQPEEAPADEPPPKEKEAVPAESAPARPRKRGNSAKSKKQSE
ncbi:MAG: DNA polymerase III subunit beta [Dehalococcoidia bacterium]